MTSLRGAGASLHGRRPSTAPESVRVDLEQLGAARVRVRDERVEAVDEDAYRVVGDDAMHAVVLAAELHVARGRRVRIDRRERELAAVDVEAGDLSLLADLAVDGEAVEIDA